MEKAKGFMWGIGACATGFALAWLIGIANNGEQANKEKLAEMHKAELTACMEATKGTNQTCRIEYLKDRTDTIYAARVIKEDM